MVVVKTVKEFFLKNDQQLKKFMQYKTGIYDTNLINETVQEFYIKLIQSNALESYDPEKNSFDTYILNLFCWMLPYLSKKNFRYKHAAIPRKSLKYYDVEDATEERHFFDYRLMSYVQRVDDKVWGVEDDIFNYVHDRNPDYVPSTAYDSSLFEDTNPEALKYVEDFKRYIRNTETSKNADRMILFIEQKFQGCRSFQIAEMLGVSCNMVKFIKQNLQKKYTRWQQVATV